MPARVSGVSNMIQKTRRISAIILAKDEEDRIEECIRSLSFCDEILVVDNGSTDSTKKKAEKLHARVLSDNSTSFAHLRNVGSTAVDAVWLFYVDADELVSQELGESVKRAIVHDDSYAGFSVERVNRYLGVQFPQKEHMVRLIRKSSLLHWQGDVHETPVIKGKLGMLEGALRHDTHRSLTHMVEKTNTWSAVEAKLRFDAGHPPVVWWRIIRVMITGFYDSYIIKQGFKVGAAGFVEAMYQAFSMFVTYAKLYEMQRKK